MYKLNRTTDFQTHRYCDGVRPLWWDANHTITDTGPELVNQLINIFLKSNGISQRVCVLLCCIEPVVGGMARGLLIMGLSRVPTQLRTGCHSRHNQYVYVLVICCQTFTDHVQCAKERYNLWCIASDSFSFLASRIGSIERIGLNLAW
jgi:hypothetical protein